MLVAIISGHIMFDWKPVGFALFCIMKAVLLASACIRANRNNHHNIESNLTLTGG
jgi:hypothetical protein